MLSNVNQPVFQKIFSCNSPVQPADDSLCSFNELTLLSYRKPWMKLKPIESDLVSST